MVQRNNSDPSRREFLTAATAAGTVSVAGCSDILDGDSPEEDETEDILNGNQTDGTGIEGNQTENNRTDQEEIDEEKGEEQTLETINYSDREDEIDQVYYQTVQENRNWETEDIPETTLGSQEVNIRKIEDDIEKEIMKGFLYTSGRSDEWDDIDYNMAMLERLLDREDSIPFISDDFPVDPEPMIEDRHIQEFDDVPEEIHADLIDNSTRTPHGELWIERDDGEVTRMVYDVTLRGLDDKITQSLGPGGEAWRSPDHMYRGTINIPASTQRALKDFYSSGGRFSMLYQKWYEGQQQSPSKHPDQDNSRTQKMIGFSTILHGPNNYEKPDTHGRFDPSTLVLPTEQAMVKTAELFDIENTENHSDALKLKKAVNYMNEELTESEHDIGLDYREEDEMFEIYSLEPNMLEWIDDYEENVFPSDFTHAEGYSGEKKDYRIKDKKLEFKLT